MANLCENRVRLSGDEIQVKELIDLVGEDFDFNALIPTNSNSREEAEEKWGTQCLAYDVCMEELCSDEYEFCFITNWCPPQKIYDEIRRRFPDIIIEWFYEEPSCGLRGYLGASEFDYHIIKINLDGRAEAVVGPFTKKTAEDRFAEYINDGEYNCIIVKVTGGSEIDIDI